MCYIVKKIKNMQKYRKTAVFL